MWIRLLESEKKRVTRTEKLFAGDIESIAQSFCNHIPRKKQSGEWEVLIAGTMPLRPNNPIVGWTILEEIEFYNKLVKFIIVNEEVVLGKIIFKPHPRTPREVLNRYREGLSCFVDPLTDGNPIEIELASTPSISSVYTYMSDSALVAQVFFGRKGVLVDPTTIFRKLTYPSAALVRWRAKYCGLKILPVSDIISQ